MSIAKWLDSVAIPSGKPFRISAKMKSGKPYQYVTFVTEEQFKRWLSLHRSTITHIKLK